MAEKQKYFEMATKERNRPASTSDQQPTYFRPPLPRNITSRWDTESIPEPRVPLKMADIIQDVNHNVGEFLQTTPEGEVKDVDLPSPELLKGMREGFLKNVAREYGDFRSKFGENLADSCEKSAKDFCCGDF